MTTIEFSRIGALTTVRMSGHAEYSPGADIVCAAASVLVCTLIAALQDERDAGGLKFLVTRHEKGDAFVQFEPAPAAGVRVRAIADTALAGFSLLAGHYPDNVLLKNFNG